MCVCECVCVSAQWQPPHFSTSSTNVWTSGTSLHIPRCRCGNIEKSDWKSVTRQRALNWNEPLPVGLQMMRGANSYLPSNLLPAVNLIKLQGSAANPRNNLCELQPVGSGRPTNSVIYSMYFTHTHSHCSQSCYSVQEIVPSFMEHANEGKLKHKIFLGHREVLWKSAQAALLLMWPCFRGSSIPRKKKCPPSLFIPASAAVFHASRCGKN